MNVHLLGPVEVCLDGRPIELGARKQRAVLAMLALQVGCTVPVARLAEGLWGDEQPRSSPKMVQLYVHQLRRLLAGNGAEIVTRGRGYELRLADGEVDAIRFERLLDADRPREALALWRSGPLSDVADEPFAAAEIRRLEELRVRAAELAIDADLAAGRDGEVLGEVEALLEHEPLRERLHAQRMLALYRSGRQADALEAYRSARSVLVEQIGVEPGPELRRLHEAILRQDPSLEAPAVLPSELDTDTPLDGRERELAWLRRHWRRVRGGDGRLVLVTGIAGAGKTRLVAELAAEVLREHGAVAYAVGAPEEMPATRRPALLVLDDVDGASEAELARLVTPRVLVVATAASAVGAVDTLTLTPLGANAVRAVARRYVSTDTEVPVDRLLAVSGGVPARLHAAATEWAHGLAARRVGDAAGRVAAERPVLRAAEDALEANVIDLQVARVRGQATRDLVVCPFKGLASFEVEDGEIFFGREQLVAEMVARLTGSPLLGIVGGSGSGKSSALKAGLLAALTSGVLPGSGRWGQALLRPGEHPLRALEDATANPEPRVVAVDQFEELFTTCRDEDERAAFVGTLVDLARGRRVAVVIAVRADFYGRCAAYSAFARLLASNHVLVGAMDRDELRRAITLPARRAGLRSEPELVDALVSDVEGRPGALPLLSTALVELWRHRDGRELRLAGYERAGGVSGAVARLAEQAFARLSPDQREVARRVFLRLAGEGEGDAVVRRRVELSELEGATEVLALLADERLVTIGDDAAEVAHEALLREWPRLRDWIQEDADGRQVHQHLIHAAHDWLAGGRDGAELYRGARLAGALDWSAAHETELNELEREFLLASRADAEAESRRQRRTNRRLRALLGGVAGLLALALVAGAVAVSQRGEARHAADTADAQRLGAEALTRDQLDQALLLARAGVDLDDSVATRSQLLAVLMRNPQALGTLPGDWEPLHYQSLTPDGRLLAVGTSVGTVTFFDTASRRLVGQPYRLDAGFVNDLRFSPDGMTLAVTGWGAAEGVSGGVVDLVDARTHERRLHIVVPPAPEPAKWLGVHVLFLPNGRDVIVQQVREPINLRGPSSVLRRFDGTTGAPIGPPVQVSRHQTIAMWGTADRRRLFVTSLQDGETHMLDAERLRVLRRWPIGDFAGVVSADGTAFALGSQEGEVRLLDLRSGRLRSFAGGHDASVLRMRFTPDARTLVTTGADGVVMVWDVARGEVRQALAGHVRGLVWGLEVSPDGRTAYSAGEDQRAFVWDLEGDRSLVRSFAVDRPFLPDDDDRLPRGLAVSPDGRTLAIGHSDGKVDLVDARTLRTRASFRAMRGFVAGLAFRPDGRMLAASGQHGQLTLWDARTLRPLGELPGQKTTSQALAFSPDGALLAAAEVGILTEEPEAEYQGGVVRVWDVRRRLPTGRPVPRTAFSLAFSPNGRLLAIAAGRDPTEIRDPRSGKLVARLRTPFDARSVTFSPDGRRILTGHFDGTIQAWSTESWKPDGRLIERHDGKRVLWMGFSREGRMLATAGQDGVVAITDVATLAPIGTPLVIEPETYVAAALSPDGRHLFAVSGNRAALRWNITPAAWLRHACNVAGRELTHREWEDALAGRPYRAIC